MKNPTILPINFDEVNCTYTGDGTTVKNLPTCVAINNNPALPPGANYVISKWKLSPEDIQRIMETGEMYMITMGTGVTPTVLLTESPLTPEYGFEPKRNDNGGGGNDDAPDMDAAIRGLLN